MNGGIAAYLCAMVLCALILLTSGCGTSRRGSPAQSAFEPETQAQSRGERVFMSYCNGCHPNGEPGLGPGLNDKPLPGFIIRFQIRNGLGVMPAFPAEIIPDDELDDLVAYLIELRRHVDGSAESAGN